MASARSADTVISMRSLLTAGLLALVAAPQDEGHRTLVLDAPSGAFTSLHYGPEVRVPYLWPVRGPGGIEMTRAFPVAPARDGEAKDHPHHTSMWLAHGDVNGHDFWHSKGATPRVDVVGEPKVAVKAGVTTVDMIADWVAKPGEALLREPRAHIEHDEAAAPRFEIAVDSVQFLVEDLLLVPHLLPQRTDSFVSAAVVLGFLRGLRLADGLEHATRPHPRTTDIPGMPDIEDCLRLHAVGFTLPRSSPTGRCALTAPFHPCRREPAVCFLWHYPWLDD